MHWVLVLALAGIGCFVRAFSLPFYHRSDVQMMQASGIGLILLAILVFFITKDKNSKKD